MDVDDFLAELDDTIAGRDSPGESKAPTTSIHKAPSLSRPSAAPTSASTAPMTFGTTAQKCGKDANGSVGGRAGSLTKGGREGKDVGVSVDALLSELDSIVDNEEGGGVSAGKPAAAPCFGLGTSGPRKCVPVYLGGEDAGELKGRALCTRLRCTSCDFDVLRIPGRRWNDRVNYMFFRNNSPNMDRLKINLVADLASAAYCCQCQWASVTKLLNLGSSGKLRGWCCAGHSA